MGCQGRDETMSIVGRRFSGAGREDGGAVSRDEAPLKRCPTYEVDACPTYEVDACPTYVMDAPTYVMDARPTQALSIVGHRFSGAGRAKAMRLARISTPQTSA